MSTIRGVARYALKKIIAEDKSKRAQKTAEFLNEAIKRQCADYDITQIPFKKYLTDNPEILETLSRVFSEPGSISLFVSQCGSGKTYLACVELPSIAYRLGKAIILLTPNTIQSDQNTKYEYLNPLTGKMEHVIAITANNKNDIKIEPGKVYSIVYDSAKSRFDSIPYDKMGNAIVIVDEAHQFESAVDYRSVAINQLKEICRNVCQAGGNVVYMTGTPRRIMWYRFDHLIECYKVDENGEQVNELNVGEVQLYLNSKRNNIATAATKLIQNTKAEGGRTLAYINSKKKIRQIMETLKDTDITATSITADKKGRTVEEFTDEYGFIQRFIKFASSDYQKIIENDALRDILCIAVTSVMNAGTSIKGIILDDGTIIQDPKLTPLYACVNSNAFDLDDMVQFFARARFHLDKAMVLVNKQPDKTNGKRPDLVDCILQVAQDAIDALEVSKTGNKEILKMPNLEGRTAEALLITLPDGSNDINVAAIFSLACVKYYRQIVGCPALLAEFISDELGVPCYTNEITERLDLQLARPEAVDPQVRVLAEKAIAEDPDFFDNLLNDKYDTFAVQIRPLDGGKKVLQNMKNLYMSGRFNTEQIAATAIGMVENSRAVAVDKDGAIVNPKTEPVDDLVRQLAKMKMGRGFEGQFIKYVNEYEQTGETGSIDMIKGHDIATKLDYFITTSLGFKKISWLAKIWSDANGSVGWKKACEIVAATKEDELYYAYRAIFTVSLNAFDFKTNKDAYTNAVQQYRLLSGAEYHALRYYVDGFSYVDEDYADETDIAIRKKHTTVHFKGGLNGKTFTKYDCEQIGLQFPSILKKMGIKANRVKPYTWKEIDKGIRSQFRCYNVKDADGHVVEGKTRIKGLQLSVRKIFGEAPLNKEEVLANYDAVMTDDHLSYEDKIAVMSHMKRELVELGYSEKQAEQARDAVVAGIAFDEDCPFCKEKFGLPYKAGALKLILDAQKTNPEREALSLQDAIKILSFSTEENLDSRTKEAYNIIEDMRKELARCDRAYTDFGIAMCDAGVYDSYPNRFDKRAIPTDPDDIDEKDRPIAIMTIENAAYEHKFYWDGKIYNTPQEAKDAGEDVDPRASVFWRTDKDAYRGWLNYYGTGLLCPSV